MSRGKSSFTKWVVLLWIFVFTIVSSGVLMLTPQPAEALTLAEAQLAGCRIAGGIYHSLALKEDGTVVAWGYSYRGQSDAPGGRLMWSPLPVETSIL